MHIPGIDVAGTIVGPGDGVTSWATGDRVIGFLPMASDGASVPADTGLYLPASVPKVA